MKTKFPSFPLAFMLSTLVAGCGDGGSAGAPKPAEGPTTLSASVSSLALSVNNTGLSANLTGNPRRITLTNTGSTPAKSVGYAASPALPAGTTISPANCGDLAPAATCILTITPGATASAATGDTNPTPVTLTISGTNTNILVPTLNVLGLGSVYQSGYVFAVDDTTPNTGNIGGKVAALTDQAAPYPNGTIWSSNGNGASNSDAAFDDVPGVYEASTNPPAACNGNLDGACTSQVIVAFYAPPQTNPAVNRSYYAAGLCSAIIAGFPDWYLPAICEMGYDNFSAGTGCGTQGAPTTQNMQSSLVDNGDIGNIFGIYWSSNEYSPQPSQYGWLQDFTTDGSGGQGPVDKFQPLGVRCARAMTN